MDIHVRITLRTNLALRALMCCAVNIDRTVRKADVALACNASENHLAQVISILAQHGFIDANRGRHGGIRLKQPAHLINIGGVFRLFESDTPFVECFGSNNTCPLVSVCWLRGAIADAVEAFYRSLDRVHLSDLVAGNNGLGALLERTMSRQDPWENADTASVCFARHRPEE